MRRLLNKKAQSTLEYAILISVILGALVGMQTYVKRGVQGKLKNASDQVGSQYEPTTSEVRQTTVHNAYTGSYTIQDGETVQNESGRTVTYSEDVTTTPGTEQ